MLGTSKRNFNIKYIEIILDLKQSQENLLKHLILTFLINFSVNLSNIAVIIQT